MIDLREQSKIKYKEIDRTDFNVGQTKNPKTD